MMKKVILFLAVFFFTFVLRAHNYDRFPSYGHLEELLYGWSGINLISQGVPISWSTLDYPKDKIVFKGGITGGGIKAYVDLVKPWLDEPPLYSLLAGGTAYLYKDNPQSLLPTSHTRLPSVLIGVLTGIVIFLLAKKLFGYWTAILAMIFWGTTPLLVFSSRLSVPENLISLFLVGTLYLYYLWEDKKLSTSILVAGVSLMVILGGLAKPTGIFIAPLVGFLLFRTKKWFPAAIILLSMIIPVVIFALYGAHYDWQLFKNIVAIQGNRPVGWSGLGFLINSPSFDMTEKYFFDGNYILLLLGSLAILFLPFKHLGIKKQKSLLALKLALAYWMIIVLFSGGQQDLLPWYRYPLFPLITILGTAFLVHLFKLNNFFSTFLVAGLTLSSTFYLSNPFHPDVRPTFFRLAMIVILLPSLASLLWPEIKAWKHLNKAVFLVVILIGFYLNSKLLYSYFEIICESKTCPIGPSTWLSTLHFPFIGKFFLP